MNLPVKSCLLISVTNILIFLYFLSTCRKNDGPDSYGATPTVLQIRENLEIDDTFPIVFYSTAYLDYRYPVPRLRVFSMNPCATSQEYISAEIQKSSESGNRTTKKVKLRGEPTEGECPWHWATQCFYNSYTWTAELFEKERGEKGMERAQVDGIIIRLNDLKVFLKIHEVHPKKKGGFTVCVQPVYWYSEFHNIALFIETWRSQGATRFIVYFHSSTKEVRSLLEYYQSLGILKLKPWPSFGSLSPTVSSHYHFPSVDSSTYRVGHTLAQNLCALEMSTELGAIADFDEVMVTDEGILVDYVENIMKDLNVGAIRFNHLLMKFEPKIFLLDYSGIIEPIFINRAGPPKTVFNSSSVDILLTHSVRRFIGNESTVTANGALLHYRHNSYTEDAEEIQKPNYKLFQSYPHLHIKRIQKTILKVFGSFPAAYNSTYLHILNQCISKIVGEGKCRSTVAYCNQWMNPLADWIRDETQGVFVV
ncbi:Protein CBG08807 [Caenorhabditis briggsae]|uniref:Glycosyltransferase family 92 protein n=2 Tax=Caenorhabditis briggsae TaxID=6238 RepID=A8X7F7_CAEBR|nr:Protein CBG08807 [Caenorhabditis briggsae]ULT86530.1 hypothetical protein L3Y34_006317 [Caenorhabditis briggsae]CAP28568.2 Protein CBG08807 [Caenorhabditis briggsae]